MASETASSAEVTACLPGTFCQSLADMGTIVWLILEEHGGLTRVGYSAAVDGTGPSGSANHALYRYQGLPSCEAYEQTTIYGFAHR